MASGELDEQILKRMRRYHSNGVSCAELGARFWKWADAELEDALTRLVKTGSLRVTSGLFYLPERGRGR